MLSNCRAKVKRLVYENKVSRPQEIAEYIGYLTAVSENSNVMIAGKFGKLYKLSITTRADIQESDTICIENIEYSVKGVAKRKGGNLTLTTVILEEGV